MLTSSVSASYFDTSDIVWQMIKWVKILHWTIQPYLSPPIYHGGWTLLTLHPLATRDGHFPNILHWNILAHKNEYSNIRLLKLGLMRKKLFRITKFLSRFLNKLMISHYSTMFYNNVTFYRKCKQQQQQKYIKKAFKIKQSKLKNQADCGNYSTECRLHILESAYIYCLNCFTY